MAVLPGGQKHRSLGIIGDPCSFEVGFDPPLTGLVDRQGTFPASFAKNPQRREPAIDVEVSNGKMGDLCSPQPGVETHR